MKSGIAFAALACISACSGSRTIPPPTEMAQPNPSVTGRIRHFEDQLRRDGLQSTRESIESTLREIAGQYGEVSVEYPQALTEAGLMIMQSLETEPPDKAYAEATPYMDRAFQACVRVYTAEHRECAYAIHDAALVRTLSNPAGYDATATSLFERALGVRRRVLGVDHPETAGTELALAEQRLKSCRHEPPCRSSDPRLDQATRLVLHAIHIFDENKKALDVASAEVLLHDIESERLKRAQAG